MEAGRQLVMMSDGICMCNGWGVVRMDGSYLEGERCEEKEEEDLKKLGGARGRYRREGARVA